MIDVTFKRGLLHQKTTINSCWRKSWEDTANGSPEFNNQDVLRKYDDSTVINRVKIIMKFNYSLIRYREML